MHKIILFGCQSIAIELLEYFVGRPDVAVPLVVTYEVPADLARGGRSVGAVADALGVRCIGPRYISKGLIEEIEELGPDLIVSAHYRKIFPEKLLNISRLGAINIHPSRLPDYRGPVPTAWAIINGEKRFGITIHKIDRTIDTGDILVQESFDIDENETGYELYVKAMKLGAELLIRNFDEILQGRITAHPQPAGGSYFGALDTSFVVDWRATAEVIRNYVRVRSKPYNPAQTMIMSKYLFINRVSVVEAGNVIVQRPGCIIQVLSDDKLVVSCADGAIVVEDYDIFPELTREERGIYLREGVFFS